MKSIMHMHTDYSWLQNCIKLVSYGLSIHQCYPHTEIIKISFKEVFFFFFFLIGGIFPNALLQVCFLENLMFNVYALRAALITPPPPNTQGPAGWEMLGGGGGGQVRKMAPVSGTVSAWPSPSRVRWALCIPSSASAGLPSPPSPGWK